VLFPITQNKTKSVKVNVHWGATTNSSPRLEKKMFKLLSSAMVLTVGVVGNALAEAVAVPAPEIGGGMVGTMVAAGVVYLINRRRSRS